ncbi:uncharacterized protein IUM83_05617 [Phytophthora cinnamomi]|uniref:uncharacterized protein n=1 Tax=Phytophthora cinnamomi TaxID=4785 RepID=UPI00355A6D7C|nr:hypothetical protein IUM83_05617 [Phytophthora cinnamomi]
MHLYARRGVQLLQLRLRRRVKSPDPKCLPRGATPVPTPRSSDVVPSSSASGDKTQLDKTAAKNFVARQVYLWEQMRSGRIVPPSVEHAWPTPRPDFSAWMEAAMATSDYLRRRATLENRDAAWIAELRSECRVLSVAQDLTAVAIPPSIMASRECAAVWETLFFEAGFEFINAVPEWFMTHASKINAVNVLTVVEEFQQLLTVELIEWKQLAAGSKKQGSVADDTCVAELIAAHKCTKEIKWVQLLWKDIQLPQKKQGTLFWDNQSVIHEVKNNDNSQNQKHLAKKTIAVAEWVGRGKLALEYVPSAKNVEDVLPSIGVVCV